MQLQGGIPMPLMQKSHVKTTGANKNRPCECHNVEGASKTISMAHATGTSTSAKIIKLSGGNMKITACHSE